MRSLLEKIINRVGSDWKEHVYYDQAESPEFIQQFWGPDSIFFKKFSELNRGVMVDLACGHGRHVAQILDTVGEIWLVDINKENIDYCQKRFSGSSKTKFLVNSGFDLYPLESGTADSIYSYDAMVHFEPDVIGSYITDMARVLKPGGKALIHHSAYSGNPGADYSANPHYRNFMTPSLFVHFAKRAGFDVLSQNVFAWGHGPSFVPDIDALTLMVKR